MMKLFLMFLSIIMFFINPVYASNNENDNNATFVADSYHTIFHRPSCSILDKTNNPNKKIYHSLSEAQKDGLKPCNNCILLHEKKKYTDDQLIQEYRDRLYKKNISESSSISENKSPNKETDQKRLEQLKRDVIGLSQRSKRDSNYNYESDLPDRSYANNSEYQKTLDRQIINSKLIKITKIILILIFPFIIWSVFQKSKTQKYINIIKNNLKNFPLYIVPIFSFVAAFYTFHTGGLYKILKILIIIQSIFYAKKFWSISIFGYKLISQIFILICIFIYYIQLDKSEWQIFDLIIYYIFTLSNLYISKHSFDNEYAQNKIE